MENSKITGTTAMKTYATINRFRSGHITCVRNHGTSRITKYTIATKLRNPNSVE